MDFVHAIVYRTRLSFTAVLSLVYVETAESWVVVVGRGWVGIGGGVGGGLEVGLRLGGRGGGDDVRDSCP